MNFEKGWLRIFKRQISSAELQAAYDATPATHGIDRRRLKRLRRKAIGAARKETIKAYRA
jgi:hypothetical protein